MKLLDQNGVITLLRKLDEVLIKIGEIVLSAPTIIHMTPSNSRMVISGASTGQYLIIDGAVKFIAVNNIVNTNSNNQNSLYIQFNTPSTEASIEFDNPILWKSGNPISLEPNKLYRIELTKCGNIFIGKWFSW